MKAKKGDDYNSSFNCKRWQFHAVTTEGIWNAYFCHYSVPQDQTVNSDWNNLEDKTSKIGPTRIRTGVVRIRTESDDHYTMEPDCARCDVVTKCYDLYFGSCDHIGTRWYLWCPYYVIMFGGPLGDALSFGDLCSVYKAWCSRSSGLGKK